MKRLLTTAAVLASLSVSNSVFALDGCKVLLCLAGNWKGIAACVPPVREALRDMALGHSYPHCAMAGAGGAGGAGAGGSGADSERTDEDTCPVMYSLYNPRNGWWQRCKYQGVVTVTVEGAEWSRVYWDGAGNTSTWYSADAHAQLGAEIDPKYDEDLARCGRCEPPPRHGLEN